jgi:6-phosphogluconolactonase
MSAVARPSHRRRWMPALLAAALLALGAGAGDAMADSRGAVYTQTNAESGNAVQKFDRASDGTLTPAGTFPTGGNGLSSPGGRQGAVALSDDERTVYAVNSGSDSVTAFRVTRDGLRLIGSVPSGGVAPVSVDEHRGRVYVLNSGDTPSRGTPNVASFAARFGGALSPIPGGVRDLAAGASGTAQVGVSPDGRRLLVTERESNKLETLRLDHFGRPGTPVVTPSSGTTPFGFDFDRRGRVVVSEAGESTVSSYRIRFFGGLSTITASLAVTQGAACWVAVSPNGRYAYTGNAAGSITGFEIDRRSGGLTALDADGATALLPAPFTPRDLEFDRSGRFLYAISPGGQVTGYRVARDGSLDPIGNVPAANGITGVAAE